MERADILVLFLILEEKAFSLSLLAVDFSQMPFKEITFYSKFDKSFHQEMLDFVIFCVCLLR